MKTNISKKELIAQMDDLLEHLRQVGYAVGNPELNYMTDAYRNHYARLEGMLEELIAEADNLSSVKPIVS